MKVKELIKLLKTFPQDADVMVRSEHNPNFSPGSEGYDDVWGEGEHIFYCEKDNSVNIE